MFERAGLPGLPGETPGYPEDLNGTFELAIDLPRFEDVDAEYARVVAAGARPVYAPRNEPWGMRSAMIADPEGNLIEIGSWNTVPHPKKDLPIRTVRSIFRQAGISQNVM